MSTEDRLREALRDGDRLSPPATPVAQVMRRGRRRRTRRRVTNAAAVLLLVLAVPAAVVGLRQPDVLLAPGPAATSSAPSPSPTVAPPSPDATPTPGATAPSVDVSPTPSGRSSSPGAPAPPPLAAWSPAAVLSYQPLHPGLVLIEGARREQVWDAAVLSAFADRDGGIVLQEVAGDPAIDPGPGPIVHLRSDGTEAVLLDGGGREELKEVVTVEGRRHAALTRRSGDGMEDTVEELVLLPLDGGAERDVGETGGWESSVGQLTHHQGLYVFTRCEATACGIDHMDETGEIVFSEALPDGAERAAVALSPDGRWLFRAVDDGAEGTSLTVRDLALQEDRSHDEVTLSGLPMSIDAGRMGEAAAGPTAGPSAALITVHVPGVGYRTELLRWEGDGGTVTGVDADGIARFLHP